MFEQEKMQKIYFTKIDDFEKIHNFFYKNELPTLDKV